MRRHGAGALAPSAAPAEPDDVALRTLLHRRARARAPLLPLEPPRDAPRRTLAFTGQQALQREARDTEAALRRRLHGDGDDDAKDSSAQSRGCDPQDSGDAMHAPVLSDLEELAGDLLELHARGADGCLSPLECAFAHALELAVVSALVQAVLDDATLSRVRVWLLEAAVRSSPRSRQLAFALFFNLSVRLTALGLAGAADATSYMNEAQMQTQLFQLVLEMLGKAVVVASSSRESVAARAPSASGSGDNELCWVTKALSCVLMFIRSSQGGGYSADRLRALDPQVIRFFLRESRSSQLDDELLELLVVTMYAQESSVGASTAAASNRLSLPQTALERFGGLELLLTHYYNSPSLATQRLLFMVFFDVVCHQQFKPSDTTMVALGDELWRLFQRCDLPTYVASMPSVLAAPGISRMVKKLYAAAPPALTQLMSEKQLNQFVGHLRGVLHVDEYFTQSSLLSNTIRVLRDQKKHDAAEALMAKVSHLLSSSRIKERFQGERWLAELVSFGVPQSTPSSATAPSSSESRSVLTLPSQSNRAAADQLSESVIFTGSDVDLEGSMLGVSSLQNGTDELEETCCFDEDTSIRLSARSKFWELGKSPFTAHRECFARTLGVFVKRKLNATLHPSALVGIAREVSACLHVVMQQQETSARVLAPLLLLAIDLCRTSVSKQDIRRQAYDRNGARSCDDGSAEFDLSYDSDSLASCFANGDIALDAALIKEFDAAFFVHALSALEQASHPRRRCHQHCCGSRASLSLMSDLAVCAALVLEKLHDVDTTSKWDGHIRALLPLADACNTRVAVVVSRLIVSVLKRSDERKYASTLRELHARAVDTIDADLLTLTRLHLEDLLTKWY